MGWSGRRDEEPQAPRHRPFAQAGAETTPDRPPAWRGPCRVGGGARRTLFSNYIDNIDKIKRDIHGADCLFAAAARAGATRPAGRGSAGRRPSWRRVRGRQSRSGRRRRPRRSARRRRARAAPRSRRDAPSRQSEHRPARVRPRAAARTRRRRRRGDAGRRVSDDVRAGCGGSLLAWLYEKRPFPRAKVSPCNGDFLGPVAFRHAPGGAHRWPGGKIGLEY